MGKRNSEIKEEMKKRKKSRKEKINPSKYFHKRRVKKKIVYISAESENQSSGNVAVRGSVKTWDRSGVVSGLREVLEAAAAGAGVGFQSPKPPAPFPI